MLDYSIFFMRYLMGKIKTYIFFFFFGLIPAITISQEMNIIHQAGTDQIILENDQFSRILISNKFQLSTIKWLSEMNNINIRYIKVPFCVKSKFFKITKGNHRRSLEIS